MDRRATVCGAVVLALLCAAPARAAGEASWSVESGKTVGTGQTVFWGEAGYPGIWADLIHGLDPTFEIGGRFAFNYGPEGIVDLSFVGLKLQFLARKAFFDNGKIRIAGRFDPGIMLYFPDSTTSFGITFPIGVEFGFPVSPVVSLNASFSLPMYVTFGGGNTSFEIPILFGGGVEYLLQPNLELTFRLALGPTIVAASGYFGGASAFTLYALFGVAYKFE